MLPKAILGDRVKELVIVTAPVLNAMVTRYTKMEGKPSSTFLDIWNPEGSIYFRIMIVNEPSPDCALQVLGGIRFTRNQIDEKQVSADIERNCQKFKNTKPNQSSEVTPKSGAPQ
jgi:hypothetical protein